MSSAQNLITKIATDESFRKELDALPVSEKLGFLSANGFGDVTRDDIQHAIEPAVMSLSPNDLATGGRVAASDTVTTTTTTTTVFAGAAAAVAAA
jgi:hypothetical protein